MSHAWSAGCPANARNIPSSQLSAESIITGSVYWSRGPPGCTTASVTTRTPRRAALTSMAYAGSMMQSPIDWAKSTGMTESDSRSAVASSVSMSRMRRVSTRDGDGMNASHGSRVSTPRMPKSATACSSARVRSASNSCQMYGPTSADQYVTPTPTFSGVSVDEEVDATRSGEHLPGDVARLRRAEEHDCVGDVLGFARGALSRAQDHSIVHLGIAHLPRLGGDDPWSDDIRGDPVARSFEGHRLSQPDHGSFGRGV